jgi:hypothetical protein
VDELALVGCGVGVELAASAGPAPSTSAAQAKASGSKGFLRMNGFSLTGPPPRMTTGSVVDVRRDEAAQGQVVKEWQTSESSPTERGEASPDTVIPIPREHRASVTGQGRDAAMATRVLAA